MIAHSISRRTIGNTGKSPPSKPMTFEDGAKRPPPETVDELRRKRDEFQRLASVTHDPIVAEELAELAKIYAKLVEEAEAAARDEGAGRGKPAPKS